jgi:pSer/pThr/pTyr-binding forkhead associated (FHA) protein
MSHGLDQILRYFLLALLWLFFLYAARMVVVDVRRARAERAAPSPDPSRERPTGRRAGARLRIVEPTDRSGQNYEIGEEVVLGRSPACAISLERDSFASSVHARIYQRDGEMWVEDLGSRNGTYVNDERLEGPVPLERGDLVKIGATVFEVAR